MVHTDPCACSHLCTPCLTRHHQQSQWPRSATSPSHVLLTYSFTTARDSLPVTTVQLQPQQGQGSSRLSLMHLHDPFQIVPGCVRVCQEYRRCKEESQGNQCCCDSLSRDAPCTYRGPAQVPRQRCCMPTCCETGDKKLWTISAWHRHCPVLDLCCDESRTDTSSTSCGDPPLHTWHNCYPNSSPEPKIPVSLLALPKI